MISNFQLTERRGVGPLDWVFVGTVDMSATSGAWWWKKSETKTIPVVRKYGDIWRYGLTGNICDLAIEDLVFAWEFNNTCTLETYKFGAADE